MVRPSTTEHSRGPYPAKRVLDRIAAAAACVALAPVAAIIAAAVTVEDGAVPLFLQRRVGRDRRPFTVVKFRTMRHGKVTRIGAVLRRTGLDEVPQLVNVLRGEMSIVGPRPLTSGDVERLGWGAAGNDWRFDAAPGITGLAQLLAGRGARLSRRLDRLYLRRQSAVLDCRLIALSALANLIGKRRVGDLIRPSRVARQGLLSSAQARSATSRS